MKLIKGDIVVIIALLIIVILFRPYFVLEQNQDSRFSGNAEYFVVTGQNFTVQFNAKEITMYEIKELEFSSVKNITIDNNSYDKRASVKIQYNERQNQILSNVFINLQFKKLVMTRGIYEGKWIGLNGELNNNYPNKLKSNDVKLAFQKPIVKQMFIWNNVTNETITDFNRIEFEMDNQSNIDFFSENISLKTVDTSNLQIPRSQITSFLLLQSEGILRLKNHRFDIYSADRLTIEDILPESHFYIANDPKLIFSGFSNKSSLNEDDIIMSDFSYWLHYKPEIISGFGALIAAFLAAFSFYLSYRRKKIDKIDEKQKFLNILLAEFRTNNLLTEDLKKSVENIIKDPAKVNDFIFYGFKNDGFSIFRNQGGFEYISKELYNKTVDYYTSLYRLEIKNNLKLNSNRVLYHAIKGTLMKDIEIIQECNNNIITQLNDEMQKA